MRSYRKAITPYTCPKCGHNSAYFRTTSGTFTCRFCGHIWDRGEEVAAPSDSLLGDVPTDKKAPLFPQAEIIRKRVDAEVERILKEREASV